MGKQKLTERRNGASRQPSSAYGRSVSKGYAAIQRGDFPAAIRHYERAVEANPRSAEAHNDLGSAYRCAWRLDDALLAYERANEIDPGYAPARHNRGVTLLDAGRVEDAIEQLQLALKARPDHPDSIVTLSEAYRRTGRSEALNELIASSGAARADDRVPSVDQALGLFHVGRIPEAIDAMRAVLAAAPDTPEALKYLGLLLLEEARYEEALAAFDRYLKLDPDSGEVRFYRALELLRTGRFAEGLADYEWRWRSPHFSSPRRDLPRPEWDGSPAPGSTLLLHTEQGLGDSIQFVRFSAAARPLVGRIVLECEPALAALLRTCDGIDEVIEKGRALPAFDLHLPLLSLPHRFGIASPDEIPGAPYLKGPAGEAKLPDDSRLSVGIVWAGSRTHANDENRSTTLDRFAQLFDPTRFRFVSLQKDVDPATVAAHADSGLVDASPMLTDFRTTAGVIAQLDLVITVDTAVAHLAGALGKPTWLLLPYDADWRWMTGREDTPWYPSMRLFRQQTPGDWEVLLARVGSELSSHFNSKSNSSMPVQLETRSDPVEARRHFLAAVALHQKGQFDAAADRYRKAIDAAPELPQPHNNLGALLAHTGRTDEAMREFEQAVDLKPDYGEALHNIALVLRNRGETREAIRYFERAAETDPMQSDWLNDLGNTLLGDDRPGEAIQAYDRALEADPSHVDARNNRAIVLRLLGWLEKSVAQLEDLLRDHPDHASALNNLGLACRDRGDRDRGLPWFSRALELQPDSREAKSNLGFALQELGRFDEARAIAFELCREDPDAYESVELLGLCDFDEGKFAEAEQHFEKALELNAEAVSSHWNKSILALVQGDLRFGFAEYEWRKQLLGFLRSRRRVSSPEWDGSPLEGRSVLLFREQGMGDVIQFVRYATLLKERGAGEIVLECDPPLVPLLERFADLDRVIPKGKPLPECDTHAYLLSLPTLVGTDLESVPWRGPYIHAPARAAADAIEEDASMLNVGLVWAGSPSHVRDRLRSIPVELLAPLLDVEGVRFHSLQKGPAEGDLERLGGPINPLGAVIQDWADTAAIVDRLDLVITVDTSVAHLAGAMGKRVWLLLPLIPDWRWMLDREDSPWYPTMRLFRQSELEQWVPVIDRVRNELTAVVGERPAPVRRPPAFSYIGIDWPVGVSTGWEVYGTNLATQLAAREDVQPIFSYLLDPSDLPPLARFCLRSTFALSPRITSGKGLVALRPTGNGLQGGQHANWSDAAYNVGVVFFEDTALTPDAIERANRYDLIVAGSTWNGEVLKSRGVEKVVVSLQGIDPTLFHPAPASGLFADRFVVFSGGKMEYRKGQDIVVAAFREFQRRHPEALLIFAWHNHWANIMEEISLRGLVRGAPKVQRTGEIDFSAWLLEQGLPDGSFLDLGILPNQQTPQLLREANVAVFPNRAEGGTNLVAMETMACGIPTILSANTGHLDLLERSAAYPLLDQSVAAPSAFCAGTDGWGESSVDEVVERLEEVYRDREEATRRGMDGAAAMQRLSWQNQVEHLVKTLAENLD